MRRGAYRLGRKQRNLLPRLARATWNRQCTLAVPVKRASIASPGSDKITDTLLIRSQLSHLAGSGRRCGTRRLLAGSDVAQREDLARGLCGDSVASIGSAVHGQPPFRPTKC